MGTLTRWACVGQPEVRRDATIGQAEAERDAGIRSAEAKREQEAATFEAETRIAESERGYNVQKAAYDQEVNARRPSRTRG